MDLIESSFDLLTNTAFKNIKRQPWMMPKPFVLTDAVMVKKHICENIDKDVNLSDEFKTMKQQQKLRLQQQKDSLKIKI